MKKTITLIAACIGLGVTGFAQTFTQDFESTSIPALPSGWTQNSPGTTTGWITGTNGTIAGGYFTPIATHTKFAAVNDANDTGKNANDTLFSQTFDLTGVPNAFLSYDQFFYGFYYTGGSPKETANVLVSTDGGATWSNLHTISGYGAWNTDYVSLQSYTGSSTVKLAFLYSDQGAGKLLGGIAIDNVKVFSAPSSDLKLSSVSFTTNAGVVPSTANYAAAGATVGFTGVVYNTSAAIYTSFTVMASLNGGAPTPLVITPTSSILPYTYYTWTGGSVTLPSVNQVNTLKTWVIAAADINPLNDSNTTTINTINFLPTKKIAIEEATGTWCGWCVRGIVFLDSMAKTHPGAMSLIAVHNSDPMTVSAYDSWMGTKLSAAGTGYPSIVVDRRQTLDPSALFDVLNVEGNYFGYADITLGTPTVTSHNNFSVPVTVKPSIDLSGDYRVVLVLTEDGLSGTDDATHKWSQHNYYSGGGYGAMGGFETKNPDVVGQIYNHVARSISPSVTGTSGVLPASMSAGSTYDATLTASLTDGWVSSNMHAIVMLIRNSDGQVLNTQSTSVPLGVTNVTAGINAVRLFPNPATEQSTLTFGLQESSNVQITVTDVVGRTVYTAAQQMSAGNQQLTIPTANLTPGLYNVKLQTAKGGVDARLSVVK